MQLKRTIMNPASNERGSNEELIVTELGQVGTQLDGFAHQTHRDSLYNCFKMDEIATRTGFNKLGIEKVGAIITRGVLIDVAGSKGVDNARRHLRDHGRGSRGRAEEAELVLAAGRCNHHPRRMGQIVGQGQRALHQIVSRHRCEGRRVVDIEGSDPARLRQFPDPKLSSPVHQIALSSMAFICWRT